MYVCMYIVYTGRRKMLRAKKLLLQIGTKILPSHLPKARSKPPTNYL